MLTAALLTGGVAAADVTTRGEAAARTDDPGGMSSRTGEVERAVAPLPPPRGPWPTSGGLMVMLHLVLDDPADLAPIAAAVKGLAAVDEVSRHM